MANNAANQLFTTSDTQQQDLRPVLTLSVWERSHAVCTALQSVLADSAESIPLDAAENILACEPRVKTAATGWNITFGNMGIPGDEAGSENHGPAISSIGRKMAQSPAQGIAGWSFRCDADQLLPGMATGPGTSASRRKRQTWDAVLTVLLTEEQKRRFIPI